MQENTKVKKLQTLKWIEKHKINIERGRKTSFFIFLFWVSSTFSFLYGQSNVPFHKDSINNVVFTAYAAQVVPKMKQRVAPVENFLILEGNRATVQLVSLLNQDMGRNGIGGVTHTGPVSKYEVTQKDDLIEVYFLLGAATTRISVTIRYWNDGDAKLILEPLNTNISVILDGQLYKKGTSQLRMGANR